MRIRFTLAEFIGPNIHAVTADAIDAINNIKKAFRKEKVSKYQVNQIEPSLEDVFVALIENYDQIHGKEDTRAM